MKRLLGEMDRALHCVGGMDRRRLTLCALDAETAANLLVVLIDLLEVRGYADLLAGARLVLGHVERIAAALELEVGEKTP